MSERDIPWGEYAAWLQGSATGTYYQDLLDEAAAQPARDAERRKVVKAADLPWENSPHGLLKHIVNESMNTRAETIDAYMQIIPPGSRSGKHRQLAEQAFYVLRAAATTFTSTAISKSPAARNICGFRKTRKSASIGKRATSCTFRPIRSASILTQSQTVRRASR